MSKMAPTLRDWLTDERVAKCLPEACREFRALLAVYRAAERYAKAPTDKDLTAEWRSLERALSRARAAKGGR